VARAGGCRRPLATSARRYGIWNPVGCLADGLEEGWTNDGVTGNSAQSGRYGWTLRAGERWNSQPLLCSSEPAGHPRVTHRAERRKLRAARQLLARFGSFFSGQKCMG